MSVITSLHEEHKKRQLRIKKAALKALTETPVIVVPLGSVTDIIVSEVCTYYKVRKEDLYSQRRGFITHPRQMACYLMYLTTNYTNPQIAQKLNRDKATIGHSLKKIKSNLRKHQEDINILEPRIKRLIAEKQQRDQARYAK